MNLRLVCCFGVFLAAVGCQKHKPDAPLTGNESLHDLMEDMETAAKPLLSRAPGAAIADTDVASLKAATLRMLALGAVVKARFAAAQPPTFAGFVEQLEKGVKEVQAAVDAKDAAALQAASKTLGNACGGCHKEFKH